MEEVDSKTEEQPKKFTYEQLEQIAANLSAQVQQLNSRLQEMNMVNIFKRLDYCFKVLELNSEKLNPEFVVKCAQEIEDIMTPTEEENKEV